MSELSEKENESEKDREESTQIKRKETQDKGDDAEGATVVLEVDNDEVLLLATLKGMSEQPIESIDTDNIIWNNENVAIHGN